MAFGAVCVEPHGRRACQKPNTGFPVVQPRDRRQGSQGEHHPPAAQDPPALHAPETQGGRREEPAAQDGNHPLRGRVEWVWPGLLFFVFAWRVVSA